jgi:hypothetical protein
VTLGDNRQAPLTSGRGSLWLAALVMFVLSLLLGWIPVLGSLAAGFVGGWLAKSVGTAVMAALVPAIVIALLILLVGSAFSLPLIGALVGAGALVILGIVGLPLIIGAAIGGWMSDPDRAPAA